MKKLGKKLVSLFLVICLTVSMAVIAAPTSSAVVGTMIAQAVAKKAFEIGMRAVCKVSTELASNSPDDDATIVLNSIMKILNGSGAATKEISAMCEEILAELAELREDVQMYTAEISSSINKMNTSDVKAQFSDKWMEDVEYVIYPQDANQISIGGAFDAYIKYFVASTLNNDVTLRQGSFYDQISDFWMVHYGTGIPEDIYTDESVAVLREELEEEFIKIQSITTTDQSKDTVYKGGDVYMTFFKVLEKLVDNYHAKTKATYSVVDCAATDAYYALPFAHQQYGFIESVAKKQIMYTTLVQMCFSEYISMQGEYLDSAVGGDWNKTLELPYTDSASKTEYITYVQCIDKYNDMVNDNLNAANVLMESNFRINTTAYTGVYDDVSVNLKNYMSPKDAQKVTLRIDGFESNHDFIDEIKPTEANDSMKLGSTKKYANRIPEYLNFYRVMAGDNSKAVYYILDPAQFTNESDHKDLDAAYLNDHIKRYGPAGGSDKLYGDLYPVSVDYLNMIKNMTDGENSYSVPSSSSLDKYQSLIKVPYFSAACGYKLSEYFAHYLPGGNNTYLLTSNYTNNWNTGTNTEVKKADITVVNASDETAVDSTYTIKTKNITPQDISWDTDMYSVILVNNEESYKQSVKLTLNDSYNAVNDIWIDGGDDFALGLNEEYGVVEAGHKLTVKFKLEDPGFFGSLSLVRNNSTQDTTVLLDRYDLMTYYQPDEDGYYSFSVDMPYSDIEFVLTTQESDRPYASVYEIDPANAVNNFAIRYNDVESIYVGESRRVSPGTKFEFMFSLSNVSAFNAVVAHNPETGEDTVLVNGDSLSELTRLGDYYYGNTTMPDSEVDYYIVTNEPETFVPVEPDTDEEGTFLISNYEELRSVSYFVNKGDEKYTAGNYKVVNDINCMNAGLEAIAKSNDVAFTGTFDGQGYTIRNFKIYTDTQYAALFGYVKGEIKNLKVAGNITATNTGVERYVYIAGLAVRLYEGATVSDIDINLNFKTEFFDKCDGVKGLASTCYDATIKKCFINTSVNFPGDKIVYAGITSDTGSNHILNITDCAVITSINAASDSLIFGLVRQSMLANVNINNCYVYGGITGGTLAPIINEVSSTYPNVSNCYYLDTMISSAASVATEDYGTAMTLDQFMSGEVTYKLNNGDVDGSQTWYQNIDNGEPADSIPLFNGGTVYKSAGTCISEGVGYTNIPGRISHNYNNYHVCKDCIGLRPGEAAGIYGFSIGLGGNISVQYYMVIDEEVAADESAVMIFTVPDTGSTDIIEIPVSQATVSGKFHIFECEVAAKEIPSNIYCRVTTDTRSSDTFRYSVKEYADYILANPEIFAKEIPLVKSLLNYGASAQKYFNYNVEKLANDNEYMTEDDKVLNDVDLSEYAYVIEGEQEGVSYYGSALSLKSETAVKLFFSFENEEDVETLDITVDGKNVTPVKNGSYYEIKISDIPAHKLNKMYEVKIGNLTLYYGVFSYGVTAMKGTNEALKDTVRALYAYNQKAIDYLN